MQQKYHVAGFVDCVSLSCPSLLNSTITKLREVRPGSVIEVICEGRFEAGQLMQQVVGLGHKLMAVDEDAQRNIRLLIEKTY